MRIWRLLWARPEKLLFLFVGLFVLTACGSSTSASTTASGAAATATACAQATRPATAARTAVGTLQSINGQTLVLNNQRGSEVTVTYTSSTRFTQEVAVAAASLQEGTPVRVTVTSNGGIYTATSIIVTSGITGGAGGFPGGFPRGNGTPGARAGRGNNPCFAAGRAGRGTPGAGTGTNNFRGLVGKVSQLSGSTLTITDAAGSDYTVTLTTRTQIVATKSASAATLKVGQALTVTGAASGQRAIRANLIAILLNLPARGVSATPTP